MLKCSSQPRRDSMASRNALMKISKCRAWYLALEYPETPRSCDRLGVAHHQNSRVAGILAICLRSFLRLRSSVHHQASCRDTRQTHVPDPPPQAQRTRLGVALSPAPERPQPCAGQPRGTALGALPAVVPIGPRPSNAFARRYTEADLDALAEVEREYGRLSGPATVVVLRRCIRSTAMRASYACSTCPHRTSTTCAAQWPIRRAITCAPRPGRIAGHGAVAQARAHLPWPQKRASRLKGQSMRASSAAWSWGDPFENPPQGTPARGCDART